MTTPLVRKPVELTQRQPEERAYTEVDLQAKADALGCDLVVGDERMLLLDLDSPAAYAIYARNMTMLHEQYSVARIESWPSRHATGLHNHGIGQRGHVVIHLTDPVPDVATRLLLQATLGSDPTRELATWRDHSRGYKTPNVLFRPRAVTKTEGE